MTDSAPQATTSSIPSLEAATDPSKADHDSGSAAQDGSESSVRWQGERERNHSLMTTATVTLDRINEATRPRDGTGSGQTTRDAK